MSNNIELRSDDWPIDIEANSYMDTFSSAFKARLNHPFGRKHKRLFLELFIMVNMAQLMYISMLTFAKSTMLNEVSGVTPTPIIVLCLLRHLVLFLMELGK